MTTVKNNGDACQCVLNAIANNLSYNLNELSLNPGRHTIRITSFPTLSTSNF
jgi:hypothetical protein